MASCSLAYIVCGSELKPTISLSFNQGMHDGVTKTVFKREGIATVLDRTLDRLVNVPENKPRYENWPGNPKGLNRGILLETESTNYLLNSSFEDKLINWQTEEGLQLKPVSNSVLHGQNALHISGSGVLSQIIKLKDLKRNYQYACLTGYFKGSAEDIKKIRLGAYGITQEELSPNLGKEFRIISIPGSNWVRFAMAFRLPNPNGQYKLVFMVKDIKELIIDACQFEISNFPWRASSYIPTLGNAATRGKDYFAVKTGSFPIAKGTVTIWYKSNNPYGRTGDLFSHGPVGTHSRLDLGTDSFTIGNSRVKAAKLFREENTPEQNWHFYTFTWNGEEAGFYHDAKEHSDREGHFKYKNLEKYGGSFSLGSKSPIYLGPEGIIANIDIYDQVLSQSQIQALAGKEKIKEQKKDTGIPISYRCDKAGRVSLAVYDKTGVLKRKLLIGEPKEVGEYTIYWDGRDDDAKLLPPGKYEARGVSSDIRDKWIVSIGNSGNPPWGESKVRGGLFNSVTISGNNLIASNSTLEGNRGIQCFDLRTGQVVWTSDFDPIYGDLSAISSDDKYVYVVGTYRNEKDSVGKQTYREALWRLEIKNGKLAPWFNKQEVIKLNNSRYAPDGYRYSQRYHNPATRYKDPLAYLEVVDMEVADGKLYIPFRSENVIRVYDVDNGKKLNEFKNIPDPKGIAVKQDHIYVSSANKILKYNLDGIVQGVFVDNLDSPFEVETDATGNIYVTEFGKTQQIKVFSLQGKQLKTIGTKFTKRKTGSLDQFLFPVSLACKASGGLVVADFGNGRLVFLDNKGKKTRTINAHGYGGMDGGISFATGKPNRLYTNNVNCRLPWHSHNIVAYDIDWEKGTWKAARRWQDVTPVLSKEPLYTRVLPNGRTYHFLLTRYPTVYEEMPDGSLEFCAALLHPQKFGSAGMSTMAKPEIIEDAKKLGLLNKDGWFKCRMVWTDTNRDLRIQKDEINECPGASDSKKGFYSVNDANVDENGDLLLGHLSTSELWVFKREGFDGIGNPLYSWNNARKVADPRKHKHLAGNGWLVYGKSIDKEGNVYVTDAKGDGCSPEDFRILKFGSNNSLLWQVGRKSVGLKDKPGEFSTVTNIPRVKNGILYLLDYEGTLDLYTTDGLYLATLLEAGNAGTAGPRSNWGENFFGDVVRNPKSGQVFFVINTHNFVLPGFEILGLENIRRFKKDITFTDENHALQQKVEIVETNFINFTPVYFVKSGVKWDKIPSNKTVMPEMKDTNYAEWKFACDEKNLYLFFSVRDDSPAENRLLGLDSLWDGDALELYLSTNKGHSHRQEGDYIIHFGISPNDKHPKVTMLDCHTNKWTATGTSKVEIWPNGKGYTLEGNIPLESLKLSSLTVGKNLSLDWDLVYSSSSGKYGFKMFRNPQATNVLLRKPNLWGPAKVMSIGDDLKTVYAWSKAESWDITPIQARLRIKETNNMYNARLKSAYTEKGLYLYLDVNDPDPALYTANSGVVDCGDGTNFFIDGHSIYIVASPRFLQPFLIKNGKMLSITGAFSKIVVAENKYQLEVFIPWQAIGGRKDEYKFNWKMIWSDKTGGSCFGTRSLCNPPATTMLKIKKDL